MSIILTVPGSSPPCTFSFEGPDRFLVGRAENAHFRLPEDDLLISRLHFLIEVFSPDRACVQDLGSRHGTFVNGRRVQEPADLRDGDEIRAGHTVFEVRIRPSAGASAPTWSAVGPDAPLQQSTAPALSGPGTERNAGGPDSWTTVPQGAEGGPVLAPSLQALAAAAVAGPGGFPTIPGYRIVRELGRGGMGVVYLAQRSGDNQRVALKTLQPGHALTHIAVARFVREASILRQLEHPHIIRFRDQGATAGAFFVVMDYVDGSDLRQLVGSQGPQALVEALRLLWPILEALHFAHTRGLVHRDVKPSNVLVGTKDEQLCTWLADFGLARAYQQSGLSGITASNTGCGTLAFAAPEQFLDFRGVGPAADQYGAAATLYFLLTGQSVFRDPPGDDSGSRAREVLLGARAPINDPSRRPDLPAGLADVLARALHLSPGARYPDVAAFRAALEPFAH
jgi:serine/threonine-protein kinase